MTSAKQAWTGNLSRLRIQPRLAILTAISNDLPFSHGDSLEVLMFFAISLKAFRTISISQLFRLDRQMALAATEPFRVLDHNPDIFVPAFSHRAFHTPTAYGINSRTAISGKQLNLNG
jgi:hypothetical protein